MGIKSEDLSKLGNEFTMLKTHSSINPNGTGLGLYMCKTLLKCLNGELQISSEYGKGSSFSILLPIEPLNEEEKASHNIKFDAEQTLATPITGKIEVLPSIPVGKKVLIVDDSAMNLFVLGCLLEKFGISWDKGMNGSEAFSKVKSYFASAGKPYDLILMDINMPVMGGFEAGRLIKEWENTNMLPKTTIVALSGENTEDISTSTFHQSFDLMLMKPVTSEKLKDVLFEYLGLHN